MGNNIKIQKKSYSKLHIFANLIKLLFRWPEKWTPIFPAFYIRLSDHFIILTPYSYMFLYEKFLFSLIRSERLGLKILKNADFWNISTIFEIQNHVVDTETCLLNIKQALL